MHHPSSIQSAFRCKTLRYISEVSAKNPKAVATAFDKVLESGLTMDPKLIQAAVAAHDKALDNAINNPGLVTSKADWAAVNEALARMIGSADPGKFKALLTAFPQNADLQLALFAANNPVDAKAMVSKKLDLFIIVLSSWGNSGLPRPRFHITTFRIFHPDPCQAAYETFVALTKAVAR